MNTSCEVSNSCITYATPKQDRWVPLVATARYFSELASESASQDEITQQWLPLISISWLREEGRREVHFLTNSRALCLHFREAENFAVERAKAWIDRKVLELD